MGTVTFKNLQSDKWQKNIIEPASECKIEWYYKLIYKEVSLICTEFNKIYSIHKCMYVCNQKPIQGWFWKSQIFKSVIEKNVTLACHEKFFGRF